MNLLDKYFVAFPRSPDEPAADPPADPPADPVVADPPAADPPVAADPPPAPKPQMVPVAVVADLRAKNRGLETRAQEAERRAADAEALAQRLSKGDKATDPAPKPATPVGDDAVRIAAERMLFEREVNALRDAGIAEYGATQFNDTIRALGAYGADDDAFVSQALAVAKGNNVPAHQLLHDLAQNGEKTVALVSMTPTQRIAELTRMAMAAAAPKVEPKKDPEPPKADPKPAISKAPAPKPALNPQADPPELDITNPDHHEKMTDSEFEAAYKKKYMRKTA